MPLYSHLRTWLHCSGQGAQLKDVPLSLSREEDPAALEQSEGDMSSCHLLFTDKPLSFLSKGERVGQKAMPRWHEAGHVSGLR